VGQGDALLLVFPDGARMLVDGGGFAAFGRRTATMDTGENVVAPYLWSRRIRTIDVVCLTHGHADHMNGLPAILESFHPRELWISGSGESRELDRLYQTARRLGVRVRVKREGESFGYSGAMVRIVTPARTSVQEGPPRNNDSLGLLVRYGKHSFLLPGDAERSVEESLVFDQSIGPVDVLKVAHHGGRTSTTQQLLDHIHPSIAIVSAGEGNRYGHPHPDVLDRLAKVPAAVLRTDRDGRVTVRSDGRRLEFETHRWASASGKSAR
jgi:competence protein ComEC